MDDRTYSICLFPYCPKLLCELPPSSIPIDTDIDTAYLSIPLGHHLQKGRSTPCWLAGMHTFSEPALTNPMLWLYLRQDANLNLSCPLSLALNKTCQDIISFRLQTLSNLAESHSDLDHITQLHKSPFHWNCVRFDKKNKIASLKMCQWIVSLTTSSVTCNHNFCLYAQHNTKQLLKCNLPLHKILKNSFQWEASLNLREKQSPPRWGLKMWINLLAQRLYISPGSKHEKLSYVCGEE